MIAAHTPAFHVALIIKNTCIWRVRAAAEFDVDSRGLGAGAVFARPPGRTRGVACSAVSVVGGQIDTGATQIFAFSALRDFAVLPRKSANALAGVACWVSNAGAAVLALRLCAVVYGPQGCRRYFCGDSVVPYCANSGAESSGSIVAPAANALVTEECTGVI